MTSPLSLITALARAGALDQALRLFDEGGYNHATSDPAALAVKGRLLKDRALAAHADGVERLALLEQAGTAYAAADALDPQPYLLINVATLAFLGGNAPRAGEVAGVVLERLDAPDLAETPYWIAATRAEALLLRGDVEAAGRALGEAIRLNPDGWSDHASTLRQFGLICASGGIDAKWLDRHRPPCSLHYAGHLGIATADSAALSEMAASYFAETRVGFAYGALAAGADIIIAEALLRHGVELHVILPTQREAFVAQSIAPYGEDWLPRFETCLNAAATVRYMTQVDGPYEPLATGLASDFAMGAAAFNARTLESHAVQLLVVDGGGGDYGTGVGTARDGVAWKRTGAAQRLITWPRSADVPASMGQREGRDDQRLMALLHVSFDGLDTLGEAAFARALDNGITDFWAQAKALAPAVDQPHGNGRIYGFVSVPAAARFARALGGLISDSAYTLTIAGHYGLVHLAAREVAGPALAVLIAVHSGSLPGTITIGEEFAAALSLVPGDEMRTEYMGDYPRPGGGDMRLFGLLRDA